MKMFVVSVFDREVLSWCDAYFLHVLVFKDAAKASVENSDPPSWISVARQKQKIFSSMEESPEKKVRILTHKVTMASVTLRVLIFLGLIV